MLALEWTIFLLFERKILNHNQLNVQRLHFFYGKKEFVDLGVVLLKVHIQLLG